MTKCTYFLKCSGCTSWDKSYSQQKLSKIDYLGSLLKANHSLLEIETEIKSKIEYISCGEFALRHRTDFTIEYDQIHKQHILGFYDFNKKLIPIENCLQLAPELQEIYSQFIKFKFFYNEIPLKKGSVRLRVSPTGLKGCWLDFSNLEIKQFLEDQHLLNEILDAGFIIEIGQKGKILNRQNGKLKLSEPTSKPWFTTLDNKNNSLNLNSLISDFTQPSWITAKALVQVILNWLNKIPQLQTVLEFGPGVGQFTIPFLSQNLHVTACEFNTSAATHLLQNATYHNLHKNLTLHIGDFHKKQLAVVETDENAENSENLNKFDLVFVNPARSGLQNFTDEIIKTKAPYLIYVSCFPESMAHDLKKLSDHYAIKDLKIVDQFPQTLHFETCVLLKRIK